MTRTGRKPRKERRSKRLGAAPKKLQSLVESSSDAIIEQDVDGRIISWNPAAERMFGYAPSEVIGKPLSIIVPTDLTADVEHIIHEIVRSGQTVPTFETARLRKNGERLFVSLVVSPIKDAAGNVVRLSQIARDITERKRFELALYESEAKTRAILDTAVDGIITIGELGLIESINPAAERLFGYTMAEVMGRNMNMLMPEPYHGEHDRYLRDYIKTGIARIIGAGREVIGQRKDGTRFPLELSVSEVRLGERRLFTGILRDLSERRRLEHQILQVGDRERQRIGQDLHDSLGQLLTGIAFMAKTLEQRLQVAKLSESTDAQQITALVTEAIGQAKSLARGLHPVEESSEGLMSALRQLASSNEDMFRTRCTFHCEQPVLIADNTTATHLYRIAQEAMHNAIKHGKPTGIRVDLSRSDGMTTLSVHDNGVGFSPTPATRGMGLRIMQYRATMIGATLSIRGDSDGGTRVTCSLHEPATR